MRPSARSIVTGVALVASGLTATLAAHAEPVPPPGSAATVSPPTGGTTPLALRPSKPLDLADETSHTTVGWKLGSVLLLGAVGVWGWKQRSKTVPAADTPELRILRRTSIGVRSELLVVEMDGQRLLLGVTPSTIQNLYIAPFTEDATAVAPEPREIRDAESTSSLTAIARRPSSSGAKRRTLQLPLADTVEEQARGIRAFAERK